MEADTVMLNIFPISVRNHDGIGRLRIRAKGRQERVENREKVKWRWLLVKGCSILIWLMACCFCSYLWARLCSIVFCSDFKFKFLSPVSGSGFIFHIIQILSRGRFYFVHVQISSIYFFCPFQFNFRVWNCSRLRPYYCIIIILL